MDAEDMRLAMPDAISLYDRTEYTSPRSSEWDSGARAPDTSEPSAVGWSKLVMKLEQLFT